MFRILMAALVCLVLVGDATASDLPRRPSLGAVLNTNIPPETRTAQKLQPSEGLLIIGILPGLSAEGAGLKVNDIIVSLAGKPISSLPDLLGILRAHKVGDTVETGIVRSGTRSTVPITLKGLPFESANDVDVAYDAVEAGASVRRVIITKPRDKRRHPAVLLIGGIGCYSFDAPLNEKDAYRQLVYGLTRQGFVTMRVEKSGMGDSTGAPCSEVDLQVEVNGYLAGLRKLKALDYVDAKRSFILGHSIGGIAGPMVAAQEPVRGLFVMETLGLTWFEYELINTRRQLKLGGASPSEIGAQLLLKEVCLHRLLVERAPRADIMKSNPGCADMIAYPASDAYVQQVAAQNPGEMWAKLKGVDVAVVYGAADFVTGREESKALVEAVDAARAGSATYIEIPDMDHYLIETPSQAASLARVSSGGAGAFHPRLIKIASDWLSARAR